MKANWVVFGILVVILAVLPAGAVSFNLTVPNQSGAYKVFATNGSAVASGDFNNSVALNLPEGTYYLLLNTNKNSIFASFNVASTTTVVTIDPATLNSLTVNATITNATFGVSAISVDVKVTPTAATNISWTFATNWTVLFKDDLKLTFANETRQLIYKLKLDRVEVNGANVTLTDSSYTFAPGSNYNVVLYYTSAYFISPTYLMIIIGLIAVGLIAIIVASGKKAKQAILEKEMGNFEFFRKLR